MSHSQCAVHPEREASGVCERCGAFGCGECFALVGVQRLCAACRARGAVGLPSLSARAKLAMPFVWATSGLGLVVSLLSFGLPAEGAGGSETESLPQVLALGCSGLLYLIVFIVAVVLFCRWFHLLVRHAQTRGTPLEVTPAGAVGAFFIPFVNLAAAWACGRVVSELTKSTEQA